MECKENSFKAQSSLSQFFRSQFILSYTCGHRQGDRANIYCVCLNEMNMALTFL